MLPEGKLRIAQSSFSRTRGAKILEIEHELNGEAVNLLVPYRYHPHEPLLDFRLLIRGINKYTINSDTAQFYLERYSDFIAAGIAEFLERIEGIHIPDCSYEAKVLVEYQNISPKDLVIHTS